MFPYWVIFLLPAIQALGESARSQRLLQRGQSFKPGLLWVAFVGALALMIGLRHAVGGDWGNYLRNLHVIEAQSEAAGWDIVSLLSETRFDPSYMLINVISASIGWDIYGVNLFCGAVFCVGLGRFCLSLPRPWLALAVATPYLIIVVAMGYSRQGVAVGCEMLGLVALGRGSIIGFIIWVLFGASFHKTAVVLLPIVALAGARNRFWAFLWGAVAVSVGYFVFLQKDADSLVQNYVNAEYQSSGAAIRIVMNLVPAALVLIFRKRMQFPESQERMWYWLAIISFLLGGALTVSSASTAIDRIALYMLPLQLAAFSYLPNVMGRNEAARMAVLPVLIYYAAVQFVWLNFADNAGMWVPYRFFLFEI